MNIARVYDLWSGVCYCHKKPKQMCGFIITYSPNVTSNFRGVARRTDMSVGSCGHNGFIIDSANKSTCNSLGVARSGDFISGCNNGIIVTGSPNSKCM